jgi:predicted dehydrogenase
MSELRTAVAGLGFMGGTHIEALRRLGITVVGCLGVTPEETRAGVAQHKLSRGYADLNELVSDPDVDVVHICTPNYLHHDMARQAIEAGKHVICEKPLAVTSAESAALARLAAEKGVVGAVNYNMRFYPLVHDARDRVQAGEIGSVRLVHGHYLQDWLFYPTDWNWRLEPDLGGELRAVADIGTHWFDMITWITGLKITAVMADFATVIPTRQKPAGAVETFANKLSTEASTQPVDIKTEDYASIMLRFNNGARGVVTVSQVSAGHKNHCQWELDGSSASLRWQAEDPNSLWIGHRNQPNEVVTKDPSLMGRLGRATAGYPGGHAEGYPDTFKQMFKAVYGYIGAGDFSAERPFPTFEEGHAEMVLCEAIQRSAHEERWVTVVR